MGGMGSISTKSQNHVSQPVIQLGVWQIIFVVFLCITLLLPNISRIIGLPIYSIDIFLVIPISLLLTIFFWFSYNILLYFWPSSGLDIGRVLGKYSICEDSGWQVERYTFANRKASLDLKGSSPHIMIVGGSQTGKSTTIKTILAKISKLNDSGNLILDYHGEYNYLAKNGFTIIDARDYDALAPNYSGEEFENIVSDFVEAFVIAFETAGDVQLAILKKQLEKNLTVSAALTSIQIDASEARSFTEKDRLSGLSLRLEKIARYAGGKNTLSQLTKKSRNIVFDFSGIRDRDAADFYAENVLRRYLAFLIEAKCPTNILIDEAHRLNVKFLAERGIETTTIRMAREAGKFGGRLIVASQNLVDFTPGFSANFGNIICFRIPAGADLSILENLTGIRYGMLQPVVNGFKKGEALLIGPHNHYSLVKISATVEFTQTNSRLSRADIIEESEEPQEQSPSAAIGAQAVVQPQKSAPSHYLRSEEILDLLKKHGALTGAGITKRTGYPKPAVWRHLQSLTKIGKIVRYEDVETPTGIQVFYEINDPYRPETTFHKILIAKTFDALERVGMVRTLGGHDHPDLVFNETIAIEVETGLKPELVKFIEQIKKRFAQGYDAVIVVVINQKQKARYGKTLSGLKNVTIAKFTELVKM